MPDISDAISTYIRAKDGNRPWLMGLAFAKNARLEMIVKTDAIAFPSAATGVDEISEVLVRRFSHDNENVYTFCLSPPPYGYHPKFSCDWLVGMSSRKNGDIRVGYGRYDWSFSDPKEMVADDLKITIEAMHTIGSEHLRTVMSWLSELPYPWCAAKAAVQSIPGLDELSPISEFLNRNV